MAIVATIIEIIHVFVVLFVVMIPLGQRRLWLMDVMHLTVVISLLLHWGFNNDTCALTQIESWFRDIPVTESFVHRIVSPVYLLPDASVTTMTWVIFGLAVVNVWKQRDEIRRDLVAFRDYIFQEQDPS